MRLLVRIVVIRVCPVHSGPIEVFGHISGDARLDVGYTVSAFLLGKADRWHLVLDRIHGFKDGSAREQGARSTIPLSFDRGGHTTLNPVYRPVDIGELAASMFTLVFTFGLLL